MYIGPAHAFDDVDLEYLNNEDADEHDEEESLMKIKPSPPISSLSLDSLSGIYLGFAEKVKHDEQENETRDINDINVTIIPEETETVQPETSSKGRFFFKAKKIKVKMSKPAPDECTCFNLFRK